MQKLIFAFLMISFFSLRSHATKCGEFVYNKYGMIMKYQYAPNSVTENTKKNGSSSSSTHASTEQTTGVSDPGVTTGATYGMSQSFSSYGDCSFIAQVKALFAKATYIEQNLDGIKKDVALGNGNGHIQSLAVMSNCPNSSGARLGVMLQKHYAEISGYRATDGKAFAEYIDHVIDEDAILKAACRQDIANAGN